MHRNDHQKNFLTVKKYVFLVSLSCLLVCFSCTDSEVAIIAGMKNKESISHPSESPKRWLLAHVDVETTGLLPGYHEMIDIGIVMTTLDGLIIDSLFLRIQTTHPETAYLPEQKPLTPMMPPAGINLVLCLHPQRWIALRLFINGSREINTC